MYKKIIVIFMLIITLMSNSVVKADDNEKYNNDMKRDILVIMMAYPDLIKDIAKENDKVYLITENKKIIYDDKLQKNHEEKLANPDIQDLLEQIYPLEMISEVYDKEFDPGRARNYDILGEVYGFTKAQVEKNLSSLKYVYPGYQFNGKNGACEALNKVMKELNDKSKDNPKISAILYPGSGTFNYRVVRGTGRLSPHAFGIAIDLKSDKRDFWKWSKADKGSERIKEYPKELVKTFEDNNFIWGGKWGHFDILHFEYRPEIILKAKYFGKEFNESMPWYGDAISGNEKVQEYIALIENKLD
ncbi:MAG: M15 family metallopeptidase [Clostridiaceae bacterium]|nr:M15 family metallopeptidase [Clostridiaceae bacterium]